MKNKKKRVVDTDKPIGKLFRMADDLPSPQELAKSIKVARITIMMSQASIDYFKQQARQHHTKYQRMMREVLDQYVAHHPNAGEKGV